jgi:hypothetical protein
MPPISVMSIAERDETTAGQRAVDGNEGDAQAAADEHHYGAWCLAAIGAQFGKVFGMAGMLEASAV